MYLPGLHRRQAEAVQETFVYTADTWVGNLDVHLAFEMLSPTCT